MKGRKKRRKVVAVSGGFDPLHIGHIRMFEEARKLGDKLVVILNNDAWLADKKGRPFMPQEERKEILHALRWVDEVVFTYHAPGEYFKDRSVCRALRAVHPDIFANGGDRKPDGDPVPEVALCEELGIEVVYNVGHGGKVQSSSWLTANAAKAKKRSDTKKRARKLRRKKTGV
jgi:D-beta-D-heptose 7-phosphate kinase/D-beta-D-heptose 1-phosphate adenosyltransferase